MFIFNILLLLNPGVVFEVSSYLMGKCKTIDKNWNDEITLSNELINTLISELKQV